MHNIGEGRVSLLSHGEDYVVTFPSAYGRSILTTPWVELGGKCDISCPQSGYRAEVEFKCKQFWGTEQNKIVAEVFPPSSVSKKSLLKVTSFILLILSYLSYFRLKENGMVK